MEGAYFRVVAAPQQHRRAAHTESKAIVSNNSRALLNQPPNSARGATPPPVESWPRSRRDGSERGARGPVQIVVTPGSGEGRALATARGLKRALAARGYGIAIRTYGHLDMLARWAAKCERTFSHLVCVGGDSTQSVAAGAALRLGMPFVPVPNGFGNMFAAAFGHRAAPDAVLAVIEHGEIHHIDVGQTGGELFLSHRSYGPLQEIEAAVERDRQRLRTRLLRSFAYYTTAGRYLARTALPSIRVEVEGVPLAEDAVMVTIANVETYRGFLSLTPAATPIDGVFDIFALPRRTKPELLVKLMKLWLRAPGRWDDVALSCGQCVRVSINGAAAEEMRVLPKALPVVVPSGSIHRLRERQALATPNSVAARAQIG